MRLGSKGSVLAPTLYTLWAADLILELRRVPHTTTYMYADDTATLSGGSSIALAKERAQKSADIIAAWADRWKMRVAGEKTQAIVLSQWARDAGELTVKVAGVSVKAGSQLRLLGVTFDRLLHFGPHCTDLRRRVRPRTAQLKKLTGRSWGLGEQQLRTVANGYVRGALEYAAAAWLPAASPSHVELIDRELRAAARAVTGCTASTPVHALMSEAGMTDAWSRRQALAARMVGLAASLPEGDPLRSVGEAVVPRRLKTTGWREVGAAALAAADARDIPVEARLHHTLPPWADNSTVHFHLDLGPRARRAAPEDVRRAAAEERIRELPEEAVWIWSDGSAEDGVANGGGGALIRTLTEDDWELRVPAGRLCSSTRAELAALLAALEAVAELPRSAGLPVVACLDSRAALLTLAAGASAQTTTLGASVWTQLLRLQASNSSIHLQWVSAHCGLPGNERADALAKEAAGMSQRTTSVDARTLTRAAARAAGREWRASRPAGWYRDVMADRAPDPVRAATREEAIDVHQLRSGHWGRSEQYLHRIGRRPTPECAQCNDITCPAGRCLVCGEAADTPAHVLLECPCLFGPRLQALGNITGTARDVQRDDVVAALAAGYAAHKSRVAPSPPRR
ncbi:putative RNA-directed DNA polymerase from transposon BS [Amphibalanus amphitrite]|uniref:Putative RNA-directed DNA polymerase from transposon BS n=1 Tax=Amphibalanus amphitrite TaxID=1232801 RepID=A0A6A4UV14_AMPAM|nr:putative RNA-directed DNA polymerase from transposon BS [Amphibalanus amphitrite]